MNLFKKKLKIQRLSSLDDLENEFGMKFPEKFLGSLESSISLTKGGYRNELILPEDPLNQASYLLIFNPPTSQELKDSLLYRITDKPQVLTGIEQHSKINETVSDLRQFYEGRNLERTPYELVIGKLKAGNQFFENSPRFEVVLPQKEFDIAQEFENIFEKYGVIEELYLKGFAKLKKDLEDETIMEVFL